MLTWPQKSQTTIKTWRNSHEKRYFRRHFYPWHYLFALPVTANRITTPNSGAPCAAKLPGNITLKTKILQKINL